MNDEMMIYGSDAADTFTTKDRAYADEVLSAVNEAIGLSAYSYYTNQQPTSFSTAYKLQRFPGCRRCYQLPFRLY